MDREAWRAAIHGVPKSQARLSDWTGLNWYCPLRFQGSPQIRQWECFLVFGNFSFLRLPSWDGALFLPLLSLFLSFIFFSYLLSKTMGCFSGCLMFSASIRKLFCWIYSAFKCSFDEFVGEKAVSLSHSSAIIGLPPDFSVETLQARRKWQDIL